MKPAIRFSNNSEHIRQVRESFGYSQSQFAKVLGVRQATVSDWEKGKVKPSRLAQLALLNLGMSGPR